jgi:ABC-type lipoprotein export system ATPase subunit
MKALNTDRHKSMVSDAEKLVKLARQLDTEIASNPTNELTAGELQKVAAIEKLAHNVKFKMAQSFGGGPELRSPLIDVGGPHVP